MLFSVLGIATSETKENIKVTIALSGKCLVGVSKQYLDQAERTIGRALQPTSFLLPSQTHSYPHMGPSRLTCSMILHCNIFRTCLSITMTSLYPLTALPPSQSRIDSSTSLGLLTLTDNT